jgi:DNA-binding Lrp family transcriptional regulator
MMHAYILVTMKPGFSDQAIRDIRHIDHVEKVSVIAGAYDIVVRVGVKSMEDLLQVNTQLQNINGLEKTTTHVIEKEIAL